MIHYSGDVGASRCLHTLPLCEELSSPSHTEHLISLSSYSLLKNSVITPTLQVSPFSSLSFNSLFFSLFFSSFIMSELHQAAERGDCVSVLQLLRAGRDVNEASPGMQVLEEEREMEREKVRERESRRKRGRRREGERNREEEKEKKRRERERYVRIRERRGRRGMDIDSLNRFWWISALFVSVGTKY